MSGNPTTAGIDLVRRNLDVIRSIAKQAKTYYTGTVDEYSVTRWILQWQDEHSIEIALRLLRHIHFIDIGRLNALVQSAIQKIPIDDRETATLTALGKAFDSSGLVSY